MFIKTTQNEDSPAAHGEDGEEGCTPAVHGTDIHLQPMKYPTPKQMDIQRRL